MTISVCLRGVTLMVVFVSLCCSIFGFSKQKHTHTPTYYPAMWVFCGETSGQVSLTGQALLRSTCTQILRARQGLTRRKSHTRRSVLRVCVFNRSVEVRAKRKDARQRDGLTRHGVAVEVVSDGLLQLVVR